MFRRKKPSPKKSEVAATTKGEAKQTETAHSQSQELEHSKSPSNALAEKSQSGEKQQGTQQPSPSKPRVLTIIPHNKDPKKIIFMSAGNVSSSSSHQMTIQGEVKNSTPGEVVSCESVEAKEGCIEEVAVIEFDDDSVNTSYPKVVQRLRTDTEISAKLDCSYEL